MPSAGERKSGAVAALRRWPHLPSVLLFVALAILFLAPLPAVAGTLSADLELALPLDKLVHFLLFLAAAPPWRRSFALLGASRPALAALTFATLYAAGIELLQETLTQTRAAEWGDLFAGALGALAGVVAVAGVAALAARSRRRRAGGPARLSR